MFGWGAVKNEVYDANDTVSYLQKRIQIANLLHADSCDERDRK